MEKFGKYELLRKLATGATAEVYLARAAGPMGFEKVQVIKRIIPGLAAMPRFVERFLAEAKVAVKLNHPNVVQLFDFGHFGGMFFIAMEYVDGPSLRTVCRRRQELRRMLPPAFCARVVSTACEALAYAHEFRDPLTGQPLGILHRDLTPENILVSRAGAVKVADFGMAKEVVLDTLPLHTQVGRFKYMAPEHLTRQGALDRRIDVYSLGVVLYELLTGATPFDRAATEQELTRTILQGRGIPAASLRRDLPPELGRVLDRALGPKERRYTTCQELQGDLDAFLGNQGAQLGPRDLARVLAELGALPEAWVETPDLPSDFESTRVAPASELKQLMRTSLPEGEVPVITLTNAMIIPMASGGFPTLPSGTLPGAFSGIPPGGLPGSPSGGYPIARAGALPRVQLNAFTQVPLGVPPPAPPPPPPQAAVAEQTAQGLTLNQLTMEVVSLRPRFPEEISTHVHVRNPTLELTQLDRELIPDPSRAITSATARELTRLTPEQRALSSQETVLRRATVEEPESGRGLLGPAAVAVVVALLVGGITYVALRGFQSSSGPARADPRVQAGSTERAQQPRRLGTEKASVRLTTPLPAAVRVNGTPMGNAPVELKDVPAGELRVEVSNPELGFRKTALIQLEPGPNGTLEIPLPRLPVELRVQPRARLVVDGTDLGEVESTRLELYEGWHKVQATDRRGKRLTENFIVLKDQANRFTYNLGR